MLRVVVLAVLALAAAAASAQTKLLRFPDIHGDQVVFTYAGDLWLANASGGDARRLTSHPGLEMFAKFSPNGEWVAFTGQYDGDEQVYVVPTTGGAPRQLTFYPARGPLAPRWGYDNQIYGWSRDGQSVLFRSWRDGWGMADCRLFTVSKDGGLATPLPMPVAGAGDLSPDGARVVYSPLFRDFRTWKRYQGGWAQDLYIFDIASHDLVQVTDHPRTDRDPMWVGDKIYFASDRDGHLNLYGYDVATRATAQLTTNDVWDVRWPSADDDGRIVYELNGELQVLDTGTGTATPIAIRVPTDALPARPARIAVAENIEDFGLSPKGERALFVARGDVFTAPVEKGPTRNLTHSSGAHDKLAAWSPDGKQIAFLSDRTGEEELYLINQDGSGEPRQLTRGGRAMRYQPRWSPDGERIAFSDKDGKIYVVTVESEAIVEVADERHLQVYDYQWSPHGGYLAFTLTDESGFGSIYIWSVASGDTRRITGEFFNEFNPSWDPEGNYLFYLSDRQFQPQLGSFEWNYVVDRETGIYALALRRDVANPFPRESDEVTTEPAAEPAANNDETEAKDGEAEPAYLVIDFDGLAERVARVPVEDDNYSALAAKKGHILYVRGAASYYGRESDVKPSLKIFSMSDRKETELAEGISGFALSSDGEKVLVRQRNEYSLLNAAPGGEKDKKSISTAGLYVERVPQDEWRQIFNEVWRRYRDFFYVSNLHGYDWDDLLYRYRPLLDHVGHRSDLNYVISEMIAELEVSHAYIAGGDYETPPRPQVALPGARFALDEASGRYRLSEIFQGQNEEERYRAPLTEIGVNVAEGDYVLAIDGVELRASESPYAHLVHKADRLVTLTVNDRPVMEGARDVAFNPIASETDLIYLDWVEWKRNRVAELSDGRVGYLHVPDMGAGGIREFIKWYYGQIRKEGMVVDVRRNGGGNVSQMLIERLRRELLGTRFSRTNDATGTYPAVVFHGHLVCILDQNSASDGDIFPAMFRTAGLGPLIGKRSWGGVVGITNRGTLIDGGSVNVPEFGTADANGEWIIEGEGVSPDIEVENDPASVIAGRDPQLERAVEEVLKAMQADPKKLPERPAPPVKTP
jgi:tricorn protease